MTYQEKRKLYLPTEYQEVVYEDINYVVYTFIHYGKNLPAAIIFGGKRSKPELHVYFSDEYKRQNSINKFITEKIQIKMDKDKRKKELKEAELEKFKTIKVGDIFHAGGGYDQTNCHFYQLISLKGKTGTFKGISMETVDGSEGFMSCNERPLKDNFIGESFTSRIIGDRIKPGYDRAYKCEESDTFYHSWYA